jgi:hypothetical protein
LMSMAGSTFILFVMLYSPLLSLLRLSIFIQQYH